MLEVYTRPYNPRRPLVCLDETSKQLLRDTRTGQPPAPRRAARVDYEYEHEGVMNLFLCCEPLAGRRWVDDAIAEAVEVSQPTVSRVRKQYVEQGLEAALTRRPPTREYVRKLDGAQEAHLIALACGKPPTGQARWSLRLLADKLVELEIVPGPISYQTVRRVLKKTRSSRT